MKSFKKFLTEAPGSPPKGGLADTGLGTLDYPGYAPNDIAGPNVSAASSFSSNLNNPTPSINGFALSNEVIGALGVMNIGLNPEEFNSAMAMINTAQSENIHNSYSREQVNSLINPMFISLQQQGGMSPEEAQQVADALIVGGFKLDQVYDQMLKVYMEQLKSLGKQASPGMAATLLGAQSYYDRATRELGVPQRYVDLHTKPVPGDKDIKDMGLYTPAQQGMPGM